MTSKIRKLERLLKPYEWYGGFSSEFTEFWTYEKDGKEARVDGYDQTHYRIQLENAARKLGLIR